MGKLRIDADIESLIPPLTEMERSELEAGIRADGCLAPLVVWNNPDGPLLLDGHNRYDICARFDVPFETTAIELEGLDGAKAWVIRNQLARRNLTPGQRIQLNAALEPLIAARAKENQREAGRSFGKGPQNSAEAIQSTETRQELAALSGVSHDTYTKGKKVLASDDEETKVAYLAGTLSTNKAYKRAVEPKAKAKGTPPEKDSMGSATAQKKRLRAELYFAWVAGLRVRYRVDTSVVFPMFDDKELSDLIVKAEIAADALGIIRIELEEEMWRRRGSSPAGMVRGL